MQAIREGGTHNNIFVNDSVQPEALASSGGEWGNAGWIRIRGCSQRRCR